MRILSLLMLLILILAFAGFISLNQDRIIDTVSLGYKVFSNVSLNAVVAWAFFLGVVWALILSITQEIRLRLRIAKLKSSINHLRDELDQLRTIPLRDIGVQDKEE
ncbi:LapA family protein [bacterium]|nr:LapA family protein [bacterium]